MKRNFKFLFCLLLFCFFVGVNSVSAEKFNFAAINYQGTKENIDYNNQKILFIPSNEAITPYFLMSM